MMLIGLLVIASAAYSQSKTDTLCFSMPVAKKLAFIKLDYKRLDSLSIEQKNLISMLDRSIEQKRRMLDLCYLQNSELQKQIELLKARENLAVEKAEINAKTPFFVKVKWISIGIGIGALAILSIN